MLQGKRYVLHSSGVKCYFLEPFVFHGIQGDCRFRTVTGELQVTFRGLEQDTVNTADELKKEIQSKGRELWPQP